MTSCRSLECNREANQGSGPGEPERSRTQSFGLSEPLELFAGQLQRLLETLLGESARSESSELNPPNDSTKSPRTNLATF